MARKPRCAVCNSKRWHRDGLSGSIVCEEGHLLQNYVQESIEAQEQSQHVSTRRSVRKNRAPKQHAPANDHFHGDRAGFLQAQAMQLILRHQLRVMVNQLGYPPELEGVCRDLWALLQASGGVPAAPRDFAKGDEGAGSYSGPREGMRYTRKGSHKSKVKRGEGSDADEDDELEMTTEGITSPGPSIHSSDIQDSESEQDELNPSQYPHTQPAPPAPLPASSTAHASEYIDPDTHQAEPTNPPQPVNPFAPPPTQPKPWHQSYEGDPRKRPRMDHLLLVLYLGCVTLRLPVFLHDIVRLAESQQIVYLNARQFLPPEMQQHLAVSESELLNPFSIARDDIREGGLQYRLAQLVCMYRDDWGVIFPEPNLPLMTWRICRTLAAAPLIYHATQRVLSLLPAFSLDLPIARKRHEPGTAEPHPWLPSDPDSEPDTRSDSASDADAEGDAAGIRGGEGRYPRPPRREFRWKKRSSMTGGGIGQLPEAMLSAAVVVVLKLVYALDREGEGPAGGMLAGVLPGKGEWLGAVRNAGEVANGVGDLGRLWKGEVEDMTGEEIDDYLDFVERTVVPPSRLPKRMADVDRHFPAPPAPRVDSITSRSADPSTLTGVIEKLFASLAPSGDPPSIDPPPTSAPTSPAQVAHYPPTPYNQAPLTLIPFPPELALLLSSAAKPIGLTSYSLSNPVGAIEHLLGLRERAAADLAGREGTEDAGWDRERQDGQRRKWQAEARKGRRARDQEELGRRKALDGRRKPRKRGDAVVDELMED